MENNFYNSNQSNAVSTLFLIFLILFPFFLSHSTCLIITYHVPIGHQRLDLILVGPQK